MPIKKILDQNQEWVASQNAKDPQYFSRMAKGQKPNYLFIGCSDSRVPSSSITGTGPGEMFVHRNIANLVVASDMNLLSVLQYAVEVLEIKNILVVGHYGCGGVAAAAGTKPYGLIDNWLTTIRDVIRLHETELLRIHDDEKRMRRLVELNIIEQVHNLSKTSIIQNAMRGENPPRLHGLVYDVADGRLRDLTSDTTEVLHEVEYIYATEGHAKGGLVGGTKESPKQDPGNEPEEQPAKGPAAKK
jgi:carbonic anhydrase